MDFREMIRGNFIALPTPFHADFSLDLAALRRQVRRLVTAGYATGNGVLLAGGAGGEFPTLTLDERKQVGSTVIEEAAGRIPVIFGAQHSSTLEVLELARFAERAGADAIQVGPPYYEPPRPDDVYGLFCSVSDAASVPMVIYNTWWPGTNSDMGYDQTARLIEIANVGAIKWSAPNQFTYEMVLRDFAGRIAIIDNQLCEVFAHMMGATGFVSHPPLAWPEYGLTLWRCFEERRYSDALDLIRQFRMPYYKLFYKAYDYSGSEGHFDKAILGMLGEPVGPPRPPGRPLPAALLEEIRDMLVAAGVPGLSAAAQLVRP